MHSDRGRCLLQNQNEDVMQVLDFQFEVSEQHGTGGTGFDRFDLSFRVTRGEGSLIEHVGPAEGFRFRKVIGFETIFESQHL
jgi:hypothetical protein